MSPLSGWRVLVSRPTGRASTLVGLLRSEGAVGQAIPMIGILPPIDIGPLDAAVRALGDGQFSWVGFTSVNAVDAVLGRATVLGISRPVPASTRCAAVGPTTARALRNGDVTVDLLPDMGGSAAALAAVWPGAAAAAAETVLLPQSDIAADTLAKRLRGKGFQVTTVGAYRTVPVPPPARTVADLGTGSFDAILLTSPSTVTALSGVRVASGTVIGAIGATTAAAAADSGLTVTFTAAAPTDRALINGLAAVAAARRPERK
jgi:uroporphyrinogen-III synthase